MSCKATYLDANNNNKYVGEVTRDLKKMAHNFTKFAICRILQDNKFAEYATVSY